MLNIKLFVLNLCPFCPGADIPVGHSLSRATICICWTREADPLEWGYSYITLSCTAASSSCRCTEEVDQDYKLYGWL